MKRYSIILFKYMSERIKKLISIILTIAMVLSCNGVFTFAESIDDIINESSVANDSSKDRVARYYEEYIEEQEELLLSVESDDELGTESEIEYVDEEESETESEYAEEPESDEEVETETELETETETETETESESEANVETETETETETEIEVESEVASESEAGYILDDEENVEEASESEVSYIDETTIIIEASESEVSNTSEDKNVTLVASESETTLSKSTASDIVIVDINLSSISVINSNLFGTIDDSEKYTFDPNWYETLGLSRSKSEIKRINFDYQTFGSYTETNTFDMDDVIEVATISVANVDIVKAYIMSDYTLNLRVAGDYIKISDDLNNFFGNTTSGVFSQCTSITGLDVLNVRNVTNMKRMFYGCERLRSLDLSSFDTSSTQNMEGMFYDCRVLRSVDLSSFDTSNVQNMKQMFYNCRRLDEIDIASFDTRNVVNEGMMDEMFYHAEWVETIYVSYAFVAPNSQDMFTGCDNLIGEEGTEYATDGVEDSSYAIIDGGIGRPGYFTRFKYYITRDWTGSNASEYIGETSRISTIRKEDITEISIVKYPSASPSNPIYTWELPGSFGLTGYICEGNKIVIYAKDDTDIYSAYNSSALFSASSGNERVLFSNVKRINNLNLVKTEKTINMSNMFYGMKSLIEIDVSSFSTAKVSNMSHMFENCASISNIDVSHFDTSNVEYMQYMFRHCESITDVNISTFDTKNVITMEYMFADCVNLKKVLLDYMTNDNLETIAYMFSNCPSMTDITLNHFYTKKVDSMQGVFSGCSKIKKLNLRDFNTEQVKDMSRMFYDCNTLTTIYVSKEWLLSKFDESNPLTGDKGSEMFTFCNSLVGEKGTTLRDMRSMWGPGFAKSAMFAVIDGGIGSDKEGYLTSSNYILAPTWFDSIPGDISKSQITSIKFLRYTDSKPSRYDMRFDLKDSNGLIGYVIFNSRDGGTNYYDIVICQEMNCDIFFAEDLSYLFSDEDKDNAFTSLSTISNLNYVLNRNTISMSHMFDSTNLTDFYWNLSDMSTVTDMSYMFCNIPNIETIDISKLKTSNINKMEGMFKSCSNLTTIFVSSNFTTENVNDDGIDMFDGCTNLTGAAGTRYSQKIYSDPTHAKDKTYAKGDDAARYEGYLTEKMYILKFRWDGDDTRRINNDYYIAVDDSDRERTRVASISFVRFPENAPTSYLYRWDIPDSNGLVGYVVVNPRNGWFRDVIIYIPNDFTIYTDVNAYYLFSMFKHAKEIKNLDYLDVSRSVRMDGMFQGMVELEYLDLSNFNTCKATNMMYMFDKCTTLKTLDLSAFNVDKVENMSSLFSQCENLESINFGTLNTKNVRDMSFMFSDNTRLKNLDLSAFDTSKVETMWAMFRNCATVRELDLSSFDTSRVTNMSQMFEGMTSLKKLDVSSFDTSIVENWVSMFKNLTSIEELYLQSFSSKRSDINTIRPSHMFDGDINLKTIYASKDFPTFNYFTQEMFNDCHSLVGEKGTAFTEFGGDSPEYAKIDGGPTDKGYFTKFIYKLDPEWTGDNESEFIGLKGKRSTYRKNSIKEIIIATFTDAVPTHINWKWNIPNSGGLIGYVYDDDKVMIRIPHDTDVLLATDSSFLFSSRLRGNAYKFINTEKINNFHILKTSRTKSMKGMFADMRKLRHIDLTSFITADTSDMSYLFSNCRSLSSINLSSFNTSKVTSMTYMFYNCKLLSNIDVSRFDVRNVDDMSYMFYGMESLTELYLENFDTRSLTNIICTFAGCKNLTTIYATPDFNITKVPATNRTDTFIDCEKLVGIGGTSYAGSNVSDGSYAVIDAGPGSAHSGYFTFTYIFPPTWYDYVMPDSSYLNKQDVREITFSKYDDIVPDNFVATFSITGSNGLVGYIYEDTTDSSHTYNKINIHAPNDYLIFTPEDSSYLFSCRNEYDLYFNLTKINNINYLNTSKTTNMSQMFAGCVALNNLTLDFDTSNVINMSYMFYKLGISQDNDVNIHIRSFDTKKVTSMYSMFSGISHIKVIDLSSFDTTEETDLRNMFADCTNLTTIYASEHFVAEQGGDIRDNRMFMNCNSLVGSNGTSFAEKKHSYRYGGGLRFARIDGVDGREGYFSLGTYRLPRVWATGEYIENVYNSTIRRTSVTAISFIKAPIPAPTYYEYIYTWDIPDSDGLVGYVIPSDDGIHNEIIIYAKFDIKICLNSDADNFFGGGISINSCFSNLKEIVNLNYLDTSRVVRFVSFFEGLSNIESLDLSNFDTSNATTMISMFKNCSSLKSIDVSKFDTSKVRSFSNTFAGCSSLTKLDVSNFVTENANSFSSMFNGVASVSSLELSNFNTSNAIQMDSMFYGMTSLKELNLKSFDASHANPSFMFAECINLKTIYVASTWRLNYIHVYGMFTNCDSLVGGAGTRCIDKKISDPENYDTRKYAYIDTVSNPGYLTEALDMVLVNLKGNGGVYSDGNENISTYIMDKTQTSILEKPTRVGYKFDKYFVDNAPISEIWDYGTDPKDVVATWTPNNYKIRYDANGGFGSMDVDIATYDTVYKIKENKFIKPGYDFKGFKYNDTIYNKGDGALNLTSEDNGEIVLTAEWEIGTYKINYHANGGSGEMSSETVTYGVDHVLSKNTFERDGYTFNGWSLTENGVVAYGDEATIFGTEGYREVIDLYAQWLKKESITATLKLIGNGGYINGSSVYTMHYKVGDKIFDVIKARDGFEFVGWTNESDEFVELPTVCNFTGTLTLTANWEEEKYQLVYHANNGSSEVFIEEVPVSTTSHIIKTIAELHWTKEYHNFSGWSLESDSKDIVMPDGGDIGFVDVLRVDYYAVWTGYTYTINLQNWNPLETGDSKNKVETFVYGEGKKISHIATDSYMSGATEYLFSGWANVTSPDTVLYYDNHFADRIYEVEGGNVDNAHINLSAVWIDRAVSAKLIFDANGGTVNGKETVTLVLSLGNTIPYPDTTRDLYRKDYSFGGWYESDMTTPFTETTIDFTGTKIVYASWIEGSYTLKFVSHAKDADSPVMNQETRGCLEEFNLPENKFTRFGYKFIGWDTKEDAKTVVYEDKEKVSKIGDANAEVTLYAVWKEKTYTIRFYDYNKVYQASTILSYNGSAIIYPNIVPIGKRDAGYKYNDGTIEKVFYSGQTVSRKDFTIKETSENFDLYGSVIDKVYTVTFDAGKGAFYDGTKVKTTKIKYMERIHFPSTTLKGYVLNGWNVNGNKYSSSKYEFDADVTFVASYERDNKNGGGGNGGGGGGGRGGFGGGIGTNSQSIPVTYIDQVKTISGVADIKNVIWTYDPISNRFKMGIDKNYPDVMAKYGFYLTGNIGSGIAGGNPVDVIATETYYFDKEGNMVTGWIHTLDDKWYFTICDRSLRDGQMVFGWYEIQGKWFYFTEDGSMLISAMTPDGNYVGSDGAWIQQ